MVHGIILTDANYLGQEFYVTRGNGAHRIATHLRNNGYNIEVIDFCLRWTVDEFKEFCIKLVTDKLLFLGVGSNLFFDDSRLDTLIRWFKNTYPNIPIVLGGNNVTYRNIPNIDYYVDGYAEQSILDLLEVFRGNKSEDELKWSFNDKKFLHSNKDYVVSDTSDLRIEYLESDFINSYDALGLETSRGCIFKCKFCTYPLLGKKKLDYLRDPETIKDELQANYDKWGTTRYIMAEDTFNDSIHKLQAIERSLSKLPFKIEFVTYARLDLIMAKPESVEILKNIGLRGVHFGIETFSSKAAKIIGKPTDIEKVKDGLLWWKSLTPNITTNASMIVGLPEDKTDPWENLEWYKNSNIDFYTFNPLYLVDINKAVHSSEFSKNYQSYGFVIMSDEEILKEFEIDNKDVNDFAIYKQQGHKNKIIYWKNTITGQNYFQLSRLCVEMTKTMRKRRIPCWSVFDYASLGYSIDECRTWGWYDVIPHVPVDELKIKAQEKISAYKRRKINYDYESYYKSVKKRYPKVFLNQKDNRG